MQMYKLDFPNGKSYIGITSKTAAERFKKHCNVSEHQRMPVQRAIHKYGKENVTITVLTTLRPEPEDRELCWKMLCVAEQRMIAHYNAFGENGYNLTLGGEGTLRLKIHGKELAERNRKRTRENYQKHKVKITAYKAEYRITHAHVIAKYKKENREMLLGKCAEYSLKTRDAMRERSKAYHEANAESIRARKRANYARQKDDPEFKAAQSAKNRMYYEARKALTLKAQTVLIEEI